MLDWWWKNRPGDFSKFFLRPLKVVVSLAVAVAFMPLLSMLVSEWVFFFVSRSFKDHVNEQIRVLGTYGDMFGMLNSVFSGAAFCAIYYTLRIQQKQHDLQKEDLDMKKSRAELVIDKAKSIKVLRARIPGQKKEGLTPEEKATDDGFYNATYARLVIDNSKEVPAINCRVLLTSIQKMKSNGIYEEMDEYQNTLRLLQFTEKDDAPEDRGVTIPQQCPHYFNVLSLKQISKTGEPDRLVQVAHKFSKYHVTMNLLEMGHNYRFIMAIVSDNAPRFQAYMDVSPGNNWETLRVQKVGSVSEFETLSRVADHNQSQASIPA